MKLQAKTFHGECNAEGWRSKSTVYFATGAKPGVGVEGSWTDSKDVREI